MPTASDKPVRSGRPPRLSRAEIIAAAKRIVERDGVEKLTMRLLAREVGSAPMALYHHVRDKRELLLALLDDLAERVPRPELPDDPVERIIAATVAIHDGLLEFPWMVRILAEGDLLSPKALWFPEAVIDAGIRAGLSEGEAVHAYRSVWYFTVGELIVRTAARERVGVPTYQAEVFQELDPRRTPRLAAISDRWLSWQLADTFRPGLRAIVDGLLRAVRGGGCSD
ncbi:TetR/AcrR family transcriptional regulator [Stackebrandtia nassauensis]|uniref:Transcriptional regulator, TetR family n=1 Tax=Stackebrandtia nassauensis (strain DSM 44728 / CIP 108903 / NRRL B-16338 / NBRC 102104 / LLR-40K-21) TaxID=446470 RepID=D3Q471_STANL|nr:TetR/AcrR family transcriptional regulator [Stackebrandtia nassauensis]ADD45956.1 transcriptional regulator, TetR family [Stackebrandtia nassauensis DSM 44728]